MGWFSSSRSHHHSPARSSYARSHAGSSHSSSSRHHSSTSRYGRAPREGYMKYLYHKLRHLWHKLVHYAKRHPYKVFFMVIMPLISGGVLTKLARKFGVKLPDTGGVAHGSGSRDSGYYGSEGYGSGEGSGGIMSSMGGVQGIASGIGGLASLAKMAQGFM